MIVLFWNIRGLGRTGRRELKELIWLYKIDVICLQETIKKDFNIRELSELVGGISFSWNWTAADGHSRGTLIGVREFELEAIEMDTRKFFSSIIMENRKDKRRWEIIKVYGPVQDDRKIQENKQQFVAHNDWR